MRFRVRARAVVLMFAAALPVTVLGAGVQDRLGDDAVRILRAPLAPFAKVVLRNVPLNGVKETLQIEQFEVWAPDATIIVQDGAVTRNVPRPTTRYFQGRVAGDPESLVFLAVDEGVTGIITSNSRRFDVRSNVRRMKGRPTEVATFIQQRDELDDLPPDGQFLCGNEAQPLSFPRGAGALTHSAMAKLLPKAEGNLLTGTALRSMTVALEIDSQLFANLGSSVPNINTFIGNLVGAASTIYKRDLRTELQIGFTRIQTSPGSDPFLYPGTTGMWNGSTITFGTLHALLQLGDIWRTSPPSAATRSAVVRLSGSNTLAGVAWVDEMCDVNRICDVNTGCNLPADYQQHTIGPYAYCGGLVAATGLSTTVPDPDAFVNGVQYELPSVNYWSLLEFSHELGHVAGSVHTHCVALTATEQANYGVSRGFVDICHSGESGCYSGAQSVPTEGGTIMSYCHLLGSSSSRYIFGRAAQPSEKIQAAIVSALTAITPDSPNISAPASIANGASAGASIVGPLAGQSYTWTITNGTFSGGLTTTTGTSVNFSGSADPVTLKVRTEFNSGQTNAGCGASDSKTVSFVICVAPAITTQPASVTVPVGTGVTLSVGATGTTLAYQWYVGATGVTTTPVSGGTGSTVDVTPATNTTYWVRVMNSCGTADSAAATVTVQPITAAGFFLVTPCRVLDTRGGGAIAANGLKTIAVTGVCGVAAGATSVAVNVTVVNPGQLGFVTVYPGPSNTVRPNVSTINFIAGRTLANNARITVGTDGTINIFNANGTPLDVLVDVAGYFK